MMMVIAITEKGENKMPFIDEDRLYEKIEEKYKFAQGEARKAYSDVLDTICEMPSADVQEVRHGRWILPRKKGCVTYDEVAYKECSECGEVTFLAKTKYSQMNYCPNCGAKMDLDD